MIPFKLIVCTYIIIVNEYNNTQVLSITSSIFRKDQNILIGFIILVLLNRFYNHNPKYTIRIIIHLIIISFIFDIIYFILIINSNSDDENWNKISIVKNISFTISVLNLMLKMLLFHLLKLDYKSYPYEKDDSLCYFYYKTDIDIYKPMNPIYIKNEQIEYK